MLIIAIIRNNDDVLCVVVDVCFNQPLQVVVTTGCSFSPPREEDGGATEPIDKQMLHVVVCVFLCVVCLLCVCCVCVVLF